MALLNLSASPFGVACRIFTLTLITDPSQSWWFLYFHQCVGTTCFFALYRAAITFGQCHPRTLKICLAAAASTSSWERRYYVNGLCSIELRYTITYRA